MERKEARINLSLSLSLSSRKEGKKLLDETWLQIGNEDAKNLSTTEKATHAVLLLQSGSLVSEDELLL